MAKNSVIELATLGNLFICGPNYSNIASTVVIIIIVVVIVTTVAACVSWISMTHRGITHTTFRSSHTLTYDEAFLVVCISMPYSFIGPVIV